MSNKEYFDWLYERLIHVYNENPNVDFVQSFKKRTDWLIQNTIGWISVKDRLPEEDGRYITCHATCGVPTMVNTSIFFEGRWVLVPEGEIDYWMGIPKLPKEEQK